MKREERPQVRLPAVEQIAEIEGEEAADGEENDDKDISDRSREVSAELAGEDRARADESVSGQGIGLAVAREIAASYSGSLEIGDSPLGGARVSILLPGR